MNVYSMNIINDKWNYNCPMGGITEYLTTIAENHTYNIDNWEGGNRNATVAAKSQIRQLPHVPLHFPPHVFRQGNITAFTNIVQSIRNFILHQYYISPDSDDILVPNNRLSCLELYGGVGTIGLHLVDLFSKFVCSDENPYNVQCFHATANAVIAAMKSKNGYYPTYDGTNKNFGDDLSLPSMRYESASASVMVLERMEHLNDIDIIIVDPPRKGMDTDVCRALTTALRPPATTPTKSSKPKKNKGSNVDDQSRSNEQQQMLIYVSCGFDAFVRDYLILTSSSNQSRTNTETMTSTGTNPWTIVHAEGHVLFPGSDAIETLAIFTRVKYPTKNQ